MAKLHIFSEKEKKVIKELVIRPEGLRIETISKLTSIPKRTCYRIINILKKERLIENIYPIWKILNGQYDFCHSLSKSKDIFELHNLSYVLKLIKTPDWWNKRKNKLIKLKGWNFKQINFGKDGINPYEQIINENFVIQTYPEAIIIICRKRYYGNNPYEVITEAIDDVMEIISYLEERFKFKLFPNEIPALEIRNNDYLRIKDYLAEHCKKEGHRFLVEIDKNRKVWVDYSEPFGKEANYPEGQEILEKITKDYLLKKVLTPMEMMGAISQVTQNQLMFDKNFQSHLDVIKRLGEAVDNLKEEIKRLNGKKTKSN